MTSFFSSFTSGENCESGEHLHREPVEKNAEIEAVNHDYLVETVQYMNNHTVENVNEYIVLSLYSSYLIYPKKFPCLISRFLLVQASIYTFFPLRTEVN